MFATYPHRAPRASARRKFALSAFSLTLALVISIFLTPPVVHAAHPATSSLVGPKSYYLALGDSLAFGYQPNFDFSHSYLAQWYSRNLSKHQVKSYTNYGCNGETSATFVNGGCPYSYLPHTYYSGSQLNAAVKFIKAHPGAVSPVSLDIGANDLLPDINSSTCAISSSWATDLANLDSRLTGTILPQLTAALTVNGASTPNPNICTDTWMCSSSKNIHATTTGYGVIANTFGATTGY